MSNKNKRVLKILLLFLALFIVNILVFKILFIIGFNVVMSESSYLLPSLFTTAVLLLIAKKSKYK